MVSEMRLINNNKCLSKLKCLQNIFHTYVMNDFSTFYLDGGVVLTMQKSEGVLSRGVSPRGVCPEGVLSYIHIYITQMPNLTMPNL